MEGELPLRPPEAPELPYIGLYVTSVAGKFGHRTLSGMDSSLFLVQWNADKVRLTRFVNHGCLPLYQKTTKSLTSVRCLRPQVALPQ